jgi:hypothetical protein
MSTGTVFSIFKAMNRKKRTAVLLLLLGTAVLIRLFSAHPNWVETYYSTGVYPYISASLQFLFGWLPFSFGDLLYALLIGWALVSIVGIIKKVFSRQYHRNHFYNRIYHLTVLLLLLYISFNLLWGINYNRKGITVQLGIRIEKYSAAELKMIDSLLVQKVNQSKTALVRKKQPSYSSAETFEAAAKAYTEVAAKYPFLQYNARSVKKSWWGWAGNYIGFTGYYNPFTGEAQVNTSIPAFLQPFTSCHEIAHQLGYAKENEANFVGYLAAAASKDTLLHYSVYLDLFLYTQRNLYQVDSAASRRFSKQLLPAVEADLEEWRKFSKAHQSPLEPLFRLVYGMYLKRNQQPSGIRSYDEVTGFLIAYYKKFGQL